MTSSHRFYERYTSTSSLVCGVDEDAVLAWGKGYFRVNFSKLLPSDKSASILELGCGYGRNIASLSDMGYVNCYGIDMSHEQISHARDVLQLSNVEQADALDWLSGKEAMFDCILGLDILEHIRTDDLLRLGEMMYAALKPGGSVIFQVPNGMSPMNPFVYGDLTHVRAFTLQSMQQFLLCVGFSPVRYFEVPPDGVLRRMLWRIVKPCIGLFVRVIHGKVPGGHIYTANFITLAKKSM